MTLRKADDEKRKEGVDEEVEARMRTKLQAPGNVRRVRIAK
jgi:hypothetical protein